MNRPATLRAVMLLVLCPFQATLAQRVNVYSRPQQPERVRQFDAVHYRITLHIDEEKKAYWGQNIIRLRPFNDGFATCVLDAEVLEVTSVVSEDSQPLKFEQTDHQLVVHLARPYRHDETVQFTVSYRSENPGVDPTQYGMYPGYRLGLTFADETSDNPRLVSTQSFPTGARHWFPCYDHPNDKVTSDVIVTVGSHSKVLSNGRLVKVTENKINRTKTFHWSQDKPHSTYLFVLVAGPYHVIKDSLDSLPINYWVYEKDNKDAMRSFQKTPEIIQFFSDLYGVEYPWAKYDQATVPGAGGGAESTSATILTHHTIHNQRAHQDFSSDRLVAHEAAHQWWGDLVTLRDWSHVWLNEGMATYGEYLFTRHDRGDEEGAVNLLAKKEAYLREARTEYMRPIVFDRWTFPNDNFDSHAYQKAAAVLHMMRAVMGDGPFFRTLQHFLEKHAYKSVDTHDFMISVEEATGQNLDWFFDQWFFRPGHPVFDVNYRWDKTSKKLRLRIAQTQDTSGKVPVFKMPVTIGIVTSARRVSEKIWLKRKVEEFEFDCDERPLMVRFDEGNVLLKEWKFDKSTEELLYQLKHDDVIGRVWSASELIKFKDDAHVIAGLMEAARDDPFWAVRGSAVQSLGAMKNDEHIEFFKEKSKDTNSRVRAVALKALGNFAIAEMAEYLEQRFRQDDSYLAQVEAIRAIGKCGAVSSIPFLERAATMDSPRDMIERAARGALKEIRK